jgi:selenocysteine lyase/cysteine desulfurase
MPLHVFRKSIETGNIVADLRAGLIGENLHFQTPFGRQKLTYADYTASGRALKQLEDFITERVLPFYANSHTQASFCGAHTTDLREQARSVIADLTNADKDCSVIFTGSGATSAINRLVALSGAADCPGAIVFIGPYEHHSNILPWRESGAQVIEISESPEGGPDLAELQNQLVAHKHSPLLIGSFSVASNVTGIMTDADPLTRLLKKHGALAFWDYAGGGPYLPIDMAPAPDCAKDAIVISPHKFPGGPGASGLLIIRNNIVKTARPTWPGGGTVSYVSPWSHNYLDSIIAREEAGTPNIIGDIRAALVFIIKDVIGQDFITRRERQMCARALKVWSKNPAIHLFGTDKPHRLPIFSFAVRNGKDGYLHHQLFTRLLSDASGIQARGGCVCAGPYGHRLLGVDRRHSEQIRDAVLAGNEIEKPGWIRLNFSYLMDDATVDYIIKSLDKLAGNGQVYAQQYEVDDATGTFSHRAQTPDKLKATA